MRIIRALTATTLSSTLGWVAFPLAAIAIEVAQVQTGPAQNGPAQPSTQPTPTVPLPPLSHRTVWQRGRALKQDAEAVESTYNVNKEGNRLILAVQGHVAIQSAQVQFDDGQVQSLQLQTEPYGDGQYLLLDFGGTRRVQSIQVVAGTNSRKSAFSVQLIT